MRNICIIPDHQTYTKEAHIDNEQAVAKFSHHSNDQPQKSDRRAQNNAQKYQHGLGDTKVKIPSASKIDADRRGAEPPLRGNTARHNDIGYYDKCKSEAQDEREQGNARTYVEGMRKCKTKPPDTNVDKAARCEA